MHAVLAIALALLPFQDPAPGKAPAKAADPSAQKKQPVVEWDDKTAKTALEQLGKALKSAQNLAQRTAALEPLATGSHAQLVRPLVRIVETEKSVVVQRRAVELLGNQPVDVANGAIRKLLKHSRVKNSPAVLAEIVRALAHCGYQADQWASVQDLFEESYDPERVPLHTAILDLVTAHKERQALPLLLRNLDEPIPSDVDAAHNPPAEYWKARWSSWAAWRDQVKGALFAITGQRFSTAAEAQAWLDKNPLDRAPGDRAPGDRAPKKAGR